MVKKIAKWLGITVTIVVISGVGLIFWAKSKVQEIKTTQFEYAPVGIDEFMAQADVELGERIATVRNGCVDCHGDDLAGKTIVSDPAFAIVNGPNLTPAGIGEWTNEQVAAAIRQGVDRNQKPLTLMPSHEYQNLSHQDTASLIAYLRSLSPIEKPRGEVTIGPIASLLVALGKLPTLFPANGLIRKGGAAVIKPPEEPTAEFGEYLTSSACIGCHGDSLAGGPIPGAPPDWAPAADISAGAMATWTKEDFIRAMKLGISKSGKKLRVPFPITLTEKMNDLELNALWAYLSRK